MINDGDGTKKKKSAKNLDDSTGQSVERNIKSKYKESTRQADPALGASRKVCQLTFSNVHIIGYS